MVASEQSSDSHIILGVLGGMGPGATANFYQNIVDQTNAESDQEHLHVIIDSNGAIPSRTTAILTNNLVPLRDALCKSTARLVKAGATLIAMPCNTAHVVYDDVQKACPVEILHIVRETKRYFTQSEYSAPALLATEGTIQSGLYEREFADKLLVMPGSKLAAEIHNGIMFIKSGELDIARRVMIDAVVSLKNQGADSVLFGCTEIALVLDNATSVLPIFDSTSLLARAAIERCTATDHDIPSVQTIDILQQATIQRRNTL